MRAILGRQEETETLKTFLNSKQPQFMAIYGRRRVGKTHLIRNYFSVQKNLIFFDTTGSKNTPMAEQIANFTDRIGEVFYKGAKLRRERNWQTTFKLLTEAFNHIPKDKKMVLFFDEFPWMATKNSRLLQTLDYFWNQYWSKDKRIKLIICGSSASWIIDKIINNKGGLHNRITHSMLLEPFSLKTTQEFLREQGFRINPHQVVELYMVTGGVPYYLTKFQKGLSVAQNIEQIAFKKNAFLLNEFDNLFSSLFEKEDIYIDIIRFISQNKTGVSQEKLFSGLKELSKGGQALKKLAALEDAGFIKSFIPHFHSKRGVHYRVIDEFTIFYLQWIEPIKKTLFSHGVQPHYWESEMKTQTWAIWTGYAFEAICYKHIKEIYRSLHLNPASLPSTWRCVNAQIDLLFDRPDDAITLCEIKYTNKPFIIDKAYAESLERKMRVFKEHTKTKKQLFMTLISANGLHENAHSKDLINSVVTLDDLLN